MPGPGSASERKGAVHPNDAQEAREGEQPVRTLGTDADDENSVSYTAGIARRLH